MKRRALLKSAGISALAPLATWADETWPRKQPITWICPYSPGGNSDLRSRQIAKSISDQIKQTILVENRAGAGGNIGTEMIAHAKPDSMGTNAFPLRPIPPITRSITNATRAR